MPGTTVDTAHGTTIVFGTSSFDAEVVGYGLSGQSRTMIDTTHLGTAAPSANTIHNRTFLPSDISDPGELTLDIHFNPENLPPINGPLETITLTFPLASGDSTPTIYTFSGAVSGFEETSALDDKMTATMTVKISGAITKTAAT